MCMCLFELIQTYIERVYYIYRRGGVWCVSFPTRVALRSICKGCAVLRSESFGRRGGGLCSRPAGQRWAGATRSSSSAPTQMLCQSRYSHILQFLEHIYTRIFVIPTEMSPKAQGECFLCFFDALITCEGRSIERVKGARALAIRCHKTDNHK